MPTIILGDFNTHLNTPCTRYVEEKGLTSALDKTVRHRTWYYKFLGAHYDHIFSNKKFTTISARVLTGEGGSDHWPVVATLKFNSSSSDAPTSTAAEFG